ncbi:MAG: MbnP family protein [Saprospiraceae bacterium]
MKKILLLLLPLSILFLSSCKDEKVDAFGNVDLNFVATYDGTPIVIGDQFNYDNGKIFFDKIRVYISNTRIQTDNGSSFVEADDVEVLDFTQNNTNAEKAGNGVTVDMTEVPIGGYNKLLFNVGLTNDQNAMIPADFPAGHPLNNTEPYWSDWESYIFVTISGRADLDNSGDFEQGFVYHVGGNSTRRAMNLSDRIIVADGQTTSSKINFDLKKVLYDAAGNPFDIASVSQVHTQVDIMEDFADRIAQAFSVVE